MRNVSMKIEKNILKIEVSLNAKGHPSASGKSLVIGTTEGNVPVPGNPEIKIGLNVYKAA